MIGTITQRVYFMFFMFIFGLAVFAWGFSSGIKITNFLWQKKAAQTECAWFHPDSGEFEWKDLNNEQI